MDRPNDRHLLIGRTLARPKLHFVEIKLGMYSRTFHLNPALQYNVGQRRIYLGLDILTSRVKGGLCDDIDQRYDRSDDQDKYYLNDELPQSVLLKL